MSGIFFIYYFGHFPLSALRRVQYRCHSIFALHVLPFWNLDRGWGLQPSLVDLQKRVSKVLSLVVRIHPHGGSDNFGCESIQAMILSFSFRLF